MVLGRRKVPVGCGDRDVGRLAALLMGTRSSITPPGQLPPSAHLQEGAQGDAEPRAGMGAGGCPSLSSPCRTCLLPSPVILALWLLWVQVIPGAVPAGHKKRTFHNGNNQPLESLPQGSDASPSAGYFKVQLGRVLGWLA